ncbi:MAG: hypothetical protein ACM31D_10130 [Bacteroidota bacterium]
MTSMLSRLSALLAAAAALASCAWTGGDIGDPLERKAHWFSFVEGTDIRDTCAAGTPDRFRLVYNGVYEQQLRIYELDALRRLLVIRVVSPGSTSRLSSDDLLAPWRAVEAKVQLDEAGYNRLVGAFAKGGMFAPPPVGLELPSHSYYWTAATCHDGRYGFTAWKYPSAAFAAMGFDADLFALDTTGVAVNQAKEIPFDPVWDSKARRNEVPQFSLRVTANGILH